MTQADPPPEAQDELYEHAPVGYMTTRPDGTITRSNATLLEWLQCGALVGKRLQSILTPGARIFYETHCGPILRAEGTVRQVALDLICAGDKRLPALLDWRRIDDPQGALIGYRVLVIDASERRLYERELLSERERARRVAAVLAVREAELQRLNTGLEERVREEVAAREEAQMRAAHAERMQALGRLAGGIAHDFNNVLQAVQGGASLIERRAQKADDIRRLARLVIDAAARGASITRRLLAFSRRGDLRTEAVDPAVLLGGMYDILGHTIGAAVAVQVNVQAGLPPLLADKSQLETVLINLATNARDAMPEAGTLTFTAGLDMAGDDAVPGAGRSRPAALSPGCYVRLAVTDTGVGMPPEVLARVTEPFFTTKGADKGTGLGLAMAKGFAEQSGGALSIESAQGEGTTVTLWFPVAAKLGDAGATESDETGSGSTDRRMRILLVDDDSIVREITAEQLEAEGYAVVSAASAQAALSLLDAGEVVNLVVSDLSMPGMDGLDMIREAQRRRPGLPAILLTGFASNAAELAVGGTLSGTFSLLRKPVTGEHLAERIAMLLDDVTARRKQDGLTVHGG